MERRDLYIEMKKLVEQFGTDEIQKALTDVTKALEEETSEVVCADETQDLFAMGISTEGLDEPQIYNLVGGPFDGSTVRMAVDILEWPPKRITFESPEHDNARGEQQEVYNLRSSQDDSEIFYDHEYKTH
jgi:hypothetical protein